MIENNTHISIIIPAFNSEKFIGETLESLYIQGYKHWECLIIDDGSNDKTELIVQDFVHKDKRFKYHKRSDEYSSGGNGARNQGVALALYPNLMFLDSDDLVLPNCLENRMKFINDRGPGDLFVFHTGSFYKVLGDSDICWNKVTPKESNHELIIRFLNQDMPWCTNGVVWNTDFLKRIGGYGICLLARMLATADYSLDSSAGFSYTVLASLSKVHAAVPRKPLTRLAVLVALWKKGRETLSSLIW